MAPKLAQRQLRPKKRKAVTRDAANEPAVVVGADFFPKQSDRTLADGKRKHPETILVSEDDSDVELKFELNSEDGSGLESEDESGDESEDQSKDESVDIVRQIRNLDSLKSQDQETTDMLPIEAASLVPRNDQLECNYRITQDANGKPRYVYQEIDPVYDSDDSDNQDITNTIGNIPSTYYDAYPHIGYDINGKKIMRPARGQALDALLDSIELPPGWTGLTDPITGKSRNLSHDELDMLKKLSQNEFIDETYDPYPEMVEYFSSQTEIMPLSAAPEPKRRFIPSKNENKRIMKIVRAIREGRIKPHKPPSTLDDEEPEAIQHDIWADELPRTNNPGHLPAPKLLPPGYEDSYHPPPEYLPDPEEKAAWEALDPQDRKTDHLPVDYDALRRVPGYDNVTTVFERCLDLYLAPRMRRKRNEIDPNSLLPKLPSPDELRPFPTTCATIYRGHQGKVRCVAIDPTGTLLASGGDDGTVRTWELLTGHVISVTKLSSDEGVAVVRWRPSRDTCLVAAAVGQNIHLILPLDVHTMNSEIEAASRAVVDAGFGYAATRKQSNGNSHQEPLAVWTRPVSVLAERGCLLSISLRAPIKVISWHRRGDYFATVAPKGQSHAVAIHTLSKHLTQLPFKKLKGLPQTAHFHPSKPLFFVATQRSVRIYDLSQQLLVKILKPGARWISSMDVHPGGDNLILGSYDRRLLWHDLDLSERPYKTLRYHEKAIRAVRFHPGGLPLFADASDDGTLQIFHGKVVDDLLENATIVPLKVLKGHSVHAALGVLDVDWHPRHPWCVSAGADGTCRLWS